MNNSAIVITSSGQKVEVPTTYKIPAQTAAIWKPTAQQWAKSIYPSQPTNWLLPLSIIGGIGLLILWFLTKGKGGKNE